jgi:hypothetical protein
MNLDEQIIETYPELGAKDFSYPEGSILLADDGDGVQYIAKWNYEKPIPKGLKLGK